MRTRKEMKASAKKALKRHYGLFLLLCTVASLLGGGAAMPGSTWKGDASQESGQGGNIFTESLTASFMELAADVAKGDWEGREREISRKEAEYAQESRRNGDRILGRSEGVFALLVNKLASGSWLMMLLLGIRSLVGTDSGALAILLLGSLALLFLVEIFVVGVYRTVVLRVFLEGRCYEKVPVQRAWFLVRVRRWCHVGVVQFVTGLFSFLWGLTVIGGLVKYYSYYLVPCILAENPSIRALDAITLSRRLMRGHKWECFVLELSFLGWELLGGITMGLSQIFFTEPYKAAVLAEYYGELRRLGREGGIAGAELLNDQYLFQKADRAALEGAYADVEAACGAETAKLPGREGAARFLAETFGLAVGQRAETERLEAEQSRRFLLEYDRAALEGSAYPTRLSPIPEKKRRKWVGSLNYLRYYSVWSLVMMFFTLSFVGWLWEVSLHLVTDGEFVNRGVMHGPWLPIYGCGGVMILLLLNAFRKKPVAEFLLTILLCGCVEYFTSLYLEIAHDGTRWWDYTGYFLNLNGRICAEGLLVFGIGGMAIVYVLAPFLDGLFRKMPKRLLVGAAVSLLLVFGADQAYSAQHPNQGKGITDYGAGSPGTACEGSQISEEGIRLQAGLSEELEAREVSARW